jgi:hypothetical protein
MSMRRLVYTVFLIAAIGAPALATPFVPTSDSQILERLPFPASAVIPWSAGTGMCRLPLDGPGSEGLTRRQTYTVTEIRRGRRTQLFTDQKLIAVPSNAGPATMPEYEALAAQGIYSDTATGIRVFAGQRAETFYIDLGSVFDTLNLRRFLPSLTAEQDANDSVNPFGVNRFSGFNISTIAIEVPIKRITSDGRPPATTANPVIGIYAETDRHKVRVLPNPEEPAHEPEDDDIRFGQVSRMANPLVNELIIATPFKDAWNAADPENEADFQKFYRDPVVATELNLVFNVPIVPMGGSSAHDRTDLMKLLLKYPDQALDGTNCGSPCAELLRLDLRVPPTAPKNQRRLGSALSADKAGYPNGRRPDDDVTDIVVRVVGGTNYINARIGDGVNFLQGAPGSNLTPNGISTIFPFLPTPYDGRNRRHIDCGETGGNLCN